MQVKTLALGTLTALCLSLAGGCDDSKKDAKDAKAEAKADAKATDAKVVEVEAELKADEAKADEAKAGEAKAEAVPAGGDAAAPEAIGVAECDDYITKMTACLANGTVPADKAEAQKMGLDMYAKSWADAKKANPSDGAALVPGCKAAIEMGKVNYPTCFETK